jgi:diguanylate cyclase (GGDEF)-like protein
MPSPGASAPPRLPIEDSYLELLADTLENLDLPARGQFLQRYFRTITRLDLREDQCLQLWQETLALRLEFSDHLGRSVSLKTALMDALASAGLLHVPAFIEYRELKNLQLNAVTDPLTSLYNRRLFTENIEKELNRARRYGHPLALVLLDMHRFKEVNDKHGHPRGDEVLRAAAATLRKTLRTSDFAFRIGGDEFALLLPQTDAAQAVALSRRVGVVFAEALQPLHLLVSVSMDHGVATFPEDGDQVEELVRICDERLYHLKHGNLAQTEVANESQKPKAPPPSPKVVAPTSSQVASQPPTSIALEHPSAEPETPLGAAASAAATGLSSVPEVPTAPRTYAIQRKAERVSMSGTNAYAVLGEPGARRARVVDLGFGGVALELDSTEQLPENLLAVLHVPILPPVRVNLKPVWTRKMSEGSFRIGCCFVS